MFIRDVLEAVSTIASCFSDNNATFITKEEAEIIMQRSKGCFRMATDQTEGRLLESLVSLSSKAGLRRVPKLIIYDSDTPSATTLHTGSIIMSTGLLQRMNPAAQDFVLAHEITHIKQKSQVLASYFLLLAVPMTATAAATSHAIKDWGSKPQGKSHSYHLGRLLKFGVVFAALYPAMKAIALIPFRAFTRKQEFDADRGAVKLLGNIEGAKAEFATYEQYIAEQKNITLLPSESFVERIERKLYATHPTTEERLTYLEQVAKQSMGGQHR